MTALVLPARGTKSPRESSVAKTVDTFPLRYCATTSAAAVSSFAMEGVRSPTPDQVNFDLVADPTPFLLLAFSFT